METALNSADIVNELSQKLNLEEMAHDINTANKFELDRDVINVVARRFQRYDQNTIENLRSIDAAHAEHLEKQHQEDYDQLQKFYEMRQKYGSVQQLVAKYNNQITTFRSVSRTFQNTFDSRQVERPLLR